MTQKGILRIVFSAKYARKWLYIFDNDSVMPCEKSVFSLKKVVIYISIKVSKIEI